MPDTETDTNLNQPATDAVADPKKLILIDGNSLLYRGYFAMRSLTTSAGIPTNAVFSFTMMLLTLLTEQRPDVILCAWDANAKTFRHDEFADYKGTRPSTPSDLVDQSPIAREMVQAFNIPMTEVPGYEADDIIGTLTRNGRDLGYEVLIVTGDLDALQLVEPGVRVMTTVKGVTDVVIYDDAAVKARYGLDPHQLTDYRALKGDTSDNIPGVPGVGEKTATELLQQYGTIENLLPHIGEVKKPKLRDALEAARDQMVLSKRLATIIRDMTITEIDIPALDAAPHAPDYPKVRALFERLEFRTLLRRLPQPGNGNDDNDDYEYTPAPAYNSSTAPVAKPDRTPAQIVDINDPEYDPFALPEGEEVAVKPAPVPATPMPVVLEIAIADTDDKLQRVLNAARHAHKVGLRLHSTGDGLDAVLHGVAIALGDGIVYYSPIGASNSPSAEPLSLFDEPAAPSVIAPLPAPLASLLADPAVRKVTHDSKSDYALLLRQGTMLAGVVWDTQLAAYLLNAGRRSDFPFEEIAADYAERRLVAFDPKAAKTLEAETLREQGQQRTIEAADALLAVARVQEPRLAAEELTGVLTRLELPVAPILAEMEREGVAVDVAVLNRMAGELQASVDELETQIFTIAGEKFSIGSIKQLQHILFEKLQIPATKKTKTGYSTGADVLEELAPEYPIVKLVLNHRELTKLKNTYAESMPALVRRDTHRIHTTLNQTVAATGRLSSSNPNLQNIPIRTAIGREIRRAFVAAPGCVLVSADYSQVELRIFAHVSRDPELVAAFTSGEDIHKYTASRIYSVPVADVTADMRRASKTVNYAVIYGISAFALARRLSISMADAKELVTSYFARFPGVRTYMDETVAFAKEHGYVQTLFGRRRYIPDINSRVYQFRQAAERAAANTPIQGSAADIMKLAMIAVRDRLRDENLSAKMLLQVHDELLFECPPDEVNRLAPLVHAAMVGVYPEMTVALDVDVKTARSWADVTPVEDMGEPLDLAEI